MPEIILTTLKDLLNAEKDLLRNRYEGDFEYNQFKSHLQWRNLLLILINSVFIVLASFYILIIKNCFSLTIIPELSSILISISLFLFSVFNLYNLSISRRHFKYLNPIENKINKIEWSKWQFRDIIFKKSILLDKEYKISYRLSTDRKYCLYLIIQYKDGSFGWYNITNDKELAKDIIERDENKDKGKIKYIEKAINITSKVVEINHKKIIQKMKKEGLSPELIVGIRIRSNIKNQKIQILNLNFKEKLSP